MTNLLHRAARDDQVLLTNRIAAVTLAFWVIKVLSTTMGETAADYLDDTLGLGLTTTSLVMSALLALLLAAQFATRRYVPAVFWSTVVLISIVGTLLTDNLTDGLGVSLWVSAAVFLVLLVATFVLWYSRERTLSIHTIDTRRREAWYWVAVLFTFALGTAAGDLLSEALGLGYVVATCLFAGGIALIALAWRVQVLSAVPAFWIVYVLTRPLGASFGDLLSQPRHDGGLGLGATVTSVTFLAVIVALVVALSIRVSRRRAAGLEDRETGDVRG